MPEFRRLVSLAADHNKKYIDFVAVNMDVDVDGKSLNGIKEHMKGTA